MQERVEAAIQRCETIAEMSDKARHIRQTSGQSRTDHTTLKPVFDRAIGQFQRDYPAANVTVSGSDGVEVFVNEDLDIAVFEALTALALL